MLRNHRPQAHRTRTACLQGPARDVGVIQARPRAAAHPIAVAPGTMHVPTLRIHVQVGHVSSQPCP